jgi:hypothetical protein
MSIISSEIEKLNTLCKKMNFYAKAGSLGFLPDFYARKIIETQKEIKMVVDIILGVLISWNLNIDSYYRMAYNTFKFHDIYQTRLSPALRDIGRLATNGQFDGVSQYVKLMKFYDYEIRN